MWRIIKKTYVINFRPPHAGLHKHTGTWKCVQSHMCEHIPHTYTHTKITKHHIKSLPSLVGMYLIYTQNIQQRVKLWIHTEGNVLYVKLYIENLQILKDIDISGLVVIAGRYKTVESEMLGLNFFYNEKAKRWIASNTPYPPPKIQPRPSKPKMPSTRQTRSLDDGSSLVICLWFLTRGKTHAKKKRASTLRGLKSKPHFVSIILKCQRKKMISTDSEIWPGCNAPWTSLVGRIIWFLI